MRVTAFYVLALAFFLSILTTLTVVTLQALGYATLSDAVLLLLIGKTIPELIGMMYVVIKYLFPGRSAG
jgi:hypothetical protein